MADRPILSQYLDRHTIGTWLAQRRHIWQMDFLDAGKFADYCSKRSVKFWQRHILQLWRVGLLQSDLVLAERRFNWAGFVYVGMDEDGQHLYADERIMKSPVNGWINKIAKARPVPDDITPLFHPFRYYVLFHLQRVLETNIVPMQTLVAPHRYHELLDFSLKQVDRWMREEETVEVVQFWTDVATLAIVAEPCVFAQIFHHYKTSHWMTQEQYQELLAEQRADVRRLYSTIGEEQLEQVRQELGFDANRLDPNESVQTLVCLGDGDWRLKMEGQLGGALQLRTMNEVIRRAVERLFGIQLREEDDTGFYWGPSEHKERLYDAKRILDGDPIVTKEVLRGYGFMPDTVVRWYVEGPTEYHALNWALEQFGNARVSLVDLFGEVAAKGQGGVAFRNDLREDKKRHIFSLISIDEDVACNVSAVRKAAEDDELCGAFFTAYPDFEFANFALDELETVLLSMPQIRDATIPKEIRDSLHEAIQSAETGKELLERANEVLRVHVGEINKGDNWGVALMEYALQNPQRKHGERLETRPVMEAIYMALRMQRGSYIWHVRDYRIDTQSGLPIPRSLKREEVDPYIKSTFSWYARMQQQRQQRLKARLMKKFRRT